MIETTKIRVRNLTYASGGKEIIRDLDLSLKQGETWSVIGANGAGKTTLIRCLAGLIDDWEGEIMLGDTPFRRIPAHERSKQIAYVPQSVAHVIPFTVYEFMLQSRYPYYRHSVPSPADHDAVEQSLERVGMLAFKDRMMPTLSGGECQLVLIAAALCPNPALILFDEPITHLDYKHAIKVMQNLKQLNEEAGISLLTVLHDINQVIALGGSVLALKNGSCVFSGQTSELMNRLDVLKDIYDVSFSTYRDDENKQSCLMTAMDNRL